MTCFDVLLDLQFNDEFYNTILDNYYEWYERRVSDVVNEKGIAKVTLSGYNKKADICRILNKKFGFDLDTIDNGLENIQQYCKEMEVDCRVAPEVFGMVLATRYFKEHEIPYMFRGENSTVNYSKSLDFVSWTALSEVFKSMYGIYLRKGIKGTEMAVTVSMGEEFIVPELLQVKPYCRQELFNAFTDWLVETFDNVVVTTQCVTFIPRPLITVSSVGA